VYTPLSWTTEESKKERKGIKGKRKEEKICNTE
jgi:hypothetical protein